MSMQLLTLLNALVVGNAHAAGYVNVIILVFPRRYIKIVLLIIIILFTDEPCCTMLDYFNVMDFTLVVRVPYRAGILKLWADEAHVRWSLLYSTCSSRGYSEGAQLCGLLCIPLCEYGPTMHGKLSARDPRYLANNDLAEF